MCEVVPEMRDQNGTSREFSSFLWHYLCTQSGQAHVESWSWVWIWAWPQMGRWRLSVVDLPFWVRRRCRSSPWCCEREREKEKCHKGRRASAVMPTSRVDGERRRCSGWWANVLPFLSHRPLRTSVPNSERGLGNNKPHVVLRYTSDICLSVWAHWVSDLRLIKENISSPRAKGNSKKSNWVNRIE